MPSTALARPARLPPTIQGSSTLSLNEAQVAFLLKLRQSVGPSVPIYVTSATRTPEAQAAALVTKRNLGDNLRSLYSKGSADIIEELYAVPNTTDAMAAVIRKYMGQGRYLSRHMRGDALDIRNKDITPDQQQAIVSAATALGAKVVVESTPPHIHIERIGGDISNVLLLGQEAAGRLAGRARGGGQRAVGALRKRKRALGVAVALAAVLVIGAVVVVRKRRRSS